MTRRMGRAVAGFFLSVTICAYSAPAAGNEEEDALWRSFEQPKPAPSSAFEQPTIRSGWSQPTPRGARGTVDAAPRPVPRESVEEPPLFTTPAPLYPELNVRAMGSADPWDAGRLGVGLFVGSTTGLSASYRFLDRNSGLAVVLSLPRGLYLHGDYLFQPSKPLVEVRPVSVSWFLGAGARVQAIDHSGAAQGSSSHKFGVGMRVPAGLGLRFEDLPRLETFGEVALDVGVLDGIDTSVRGGIGGRWFF